jgi:hypothetical protein
VITDAGMREVGTSALTRTNEGGLQTPTYAQETADPEVLAHTNEGGCQRKGEGSCVAERL